MIRQLVAIALAISAVVTSQFAMQTGDNVHEACFRAKTNQERTSRNIPALQRDARLDVIASSHAMAMRAEGTIFHNPNLAREVPSFSAVGENVGMGPSCQIIHDAFMGSPDHRANILDRDYTRIGVGVEMRQDSDGGTTLFVALVFFQPAMMQPPPPGKPPSETRQPQPECTCPR